MADTVLCAGNKSGEQDRVTCLEAFILVGKTDEKKRVCVCVYIYYIN